MATSFKVRNNYLKRTYGITLAEFNALLIYQNYKCVICGRDLHQARIEVDHDHRTVKSLGKRKSVRGLLCGGRYQGCNRKLGKIDNAIWLRNAAFYIDCPPARQIIKDID